jgi:peptidoglycan-N-acetylglucosamine deacetylase
MGIRSALKRPWLGGRIFWSLPTASPFVALTFDDGPHPELTPRLLDTLAEHGVRATFFCIGKYARERPDLVKRIVAEGHTLGAHTDTHADLAKVGSWRSWQECKRSRETLEEIGGVPVRYFRPPWAHMGLTTIPIVLANRMRVAIWSFNSRDYEHLTVDQILTRVRNQKPGPGAVALFHDDCPNTIEALPRIIAEIRERNLECVTLDELAGRQTMQGAKATLRGNS